MPYPQKTSASSVPNWTARGRRAQRWWGCAAERQRRVSGSSLCPAHRNQNLKKKNDSRDKRIDQQLLREYAIRDHWEN